MWREGVLMKAVFFLNRYNKSVSLFSVICLSVVSVSCDAKPKTDKQKVSYAIGQQIGESIKSQQMDVDVDMLARSIKDVMKGKESALTRDEMREAMMNAQRSAEEKQTAEAEKNKAAGQEFLEKNKSVEGVQSTESGLQYKVVQEGSGAMPKAEDMVKVHYKGTLIDGKEFDSSYTRGEPAEFPVNRVIPGWTEALQLMKVGEKRQLWIPSELAYGPVPRPGIPGNSVLVFDVELLEIMKQDAAPKSAPRPKKKAN